MKNFEQDMLMMSAKLEKLESLANLVADPEKLEKLEAILENVDVDELQDAIKAYRSGGVVAGDGDIVEEAEIAEEDEPEPIEVEAAPVINRPVEQEEMQGDDDVARLSENNSQVVTPRLSHKSKPESEVPSQPATDNNEDNEDPEKKKKPRTKSKKKKDKKNDGDDNPETDAHEDPQTPNQESEKKKKNKKKSKTDRKEGDSEEEDGDGGKKKRKKSKTKDRGGDTGDESGKRSKTDKKGKKKSKLVTDDEEGAE